MATPIHVSTFIDGGSEVTRKKKKKKEEKKGETGKGKGKKTQSKPQKIFLLSTIHLLSPMRVHKGSKFVYYTKRSCI